MRAVDLVLDDPALAMASRHSWALGHCYEFSDVPRGLTASSEKCEDKSGDSTDGYWKAHMSTIAGNISTCMGTSALNPDV